MTNKIPLPHNGNGGNDQTNNALTQNAESECHQAATAGGFTAQQRANKRPTGNGTGKPVTLAIGERNGAYTPQVWPWSQQSGDKARLALMDSGKYPGRCMNNDPGHKVYEKRIRERLPQMLEQLDRTDLMAVYGLIEALVTSVRDDTVFEIRQLMNESFLASMGREPDGSKRKV